jgi:hypothetical protein
MQERAQRNSTAASAESQPIVGSFQSDFSLVDTTSPEHPAAAASPRPESQRAGDGGASPAGTPAPRPSKADIYGDPDRKPDVLPPQLDAIPAALREPRRWVGWRLDFRAAKDGGGKWSKVPVDVRTGRFAQSNNPATWASFDEARAAYEAGGLDGVGFMLGDGWVGLDLDECRCPATGLIDAWAEQIISRLNTYCDVSPSRTGVKLIARSDVPIGNRKSKHVEMYDATRYFCVTGVRA